MKKIIKGIMGSSSLYLRFRVFKSFRSESKDVYKSIKKHNNKDGLSVLTALRRNIHRIEKGLITVPAKPVFAEAFIGETIDCLELINIQKKEESTIIWGVNILNQYFKTVKMTPTIEEARTKYSNIKGLPIGTGFVPYKAKDRGNNPVDYGSFLKLNEVRRSIRYYQKREVSRGLIEKAVEAAAFAPSACNRQPFFLEIVDDPTVLKEVVSFPPGADSFAKNIPALIFVIGDLSCYAIPEDKHLIYIDGGLFVMNFVLALETLGISSCVIHWPEDRNREKRLREYFNFSEEMKCITTLSIGYADPEGGIPTSLKKSLSSIIKYNKSE